MKKYNISGLRGIVGPEFNPISIKENLNAFIRFLRTDKNSNSPLHILIARDARASGEAFYRFISSYCNLMGVTVSDGGIIPTPTLLFNVKDYYDGGIMITASHNPIEYNAVKFVKKGGMFLNANDINVLSQIMDSYFEESQYVTYKDIGDYKKDTGAVARHIKKVLFILDIEAIKNAKLCIAADYCNSAASRIFPEFFNQLSIEVNAINEDITGDFNRYPEPTEESMKPLSDFMSAKMFHAGFVFDPDADRVAVVLENGCIVSEEYTLALAYYHYCKHKGGGDIVVNLSTSSMVKNIASHFNHRVLFAPVGEINVTEAMKKNNVSFGGEGNGGVIFFNVGNSRDTLIATGMICELLAMEKKPLGEIIKNFPKYSMIKKKIKLDNSSLKFLDGIISKFIDNVKDDIESINRSDGIRVDFISGGFIHIRKSNTEPVLRVIAEGTNNSELQTVLHFESLFGENV